MINIKSILHIKYIIYIISYIFSILYIYCIYEIFYIIFKIFIYIYTMFFIYVYSSCTVQVLTAESPTSWFAAYSHLLALPTIRGELLWGCCRNPSTHALEHRRATRNYPHISNTLKLFRIKKATLKSFNLSLISPLPVPTTLQVARKKAAADPSPPVPAPSHGRRGVAALRTGRHAGSDGFLRGLHLHLHHLHAVGWMGWWLVNVDKDVQNKEVTS